MFSFLFVSLYKISRPLLFALSVAFVGCCLVSGKAYAESTIGPDGVARLDPIVVTAPRPAASSTTDDDLDCPIEVKPGDTKSLAGALYNANLENTQARMAATQKIFREMKYRDKFGCMIRIMDYFETIQKILTGGGLESIIALVILGIVDVILRQVCQYVITGINNLLNMVCLPVPNLALSLSLPSLQRNTCDGISLGNFMSVSGGYTGYGGAFYPGSLNSFMLMMPRKSRETNVPLF